MLIGTRFMGISMRSQRNRRTLVVLVYCLLLAFIVMIAVKSPADLYRSAGTLTVIVFLGVSRALFGKLTPQFTFDENRRMELVDTRGPEIVSITDPDKNVRVPQPIDPIPDERDIDIRKTVHSTSFKILAFYSVMVWLATQYLLNPHAPFGINGVLVLQYAMAPLLIIACTLPQALVLWNEPDIPEEQ